MSCTVKYQNGKQKEFSKEKKCLELKLVKASYKDDVSKVKNLLKKDIDVNAIVCHSKTRGNGTPLILTANTKIAKLLVNNGADVNKIYDTGSNKITAMDSILKELEIITKAYETRKKEINSFIKYMESQGAKKYQDLSKKDK